MFESGQNWQLFGYDMRDVGRHWLAAWRDFLWFYDSPIRRRLDEPVLVREGAVERCYHAGVPCPDVATACVGIVLPDELVLSRKLQIPVAAEADLLSVINLEVAASSPFGADDTASGWRVTGRGEHNLDVVIVIASKSAAMTHVAREYGSHDAQAQEVWASVEGSSLVLEGFGEMRREAFYRRRLARVAATVSGAALVLLVAVALSATFKGLELGRLEALATRIQSEAATASRHRATVGRGSETIALINELQAAYPSPYPELARLTHLLGDDAYIERFSMSGKEVDLRGRADNAAALMQQLSEQPDYAEVAAASPIRKLPNTTVEQFHLKIKREGES